MVRKPATGRHGPSAGSADRLLVAKEVADMLSVPESWVREATRSGGLPHLRLGRYVRYQRTAVLDWLQDQGAGAVGRLRR